jgi:hypothetical protein
LVTTDPLGRHDVAIPDNVRIYHIADTQHVDFPTMPKGICALPANPLDRRPVLRALLIALDRWAKDGTKPPASRYPRLDDNSLVDMAAWRFHVAGVTPPLEPNPRPRLDYGPGYDKGIIGHVLPAVLLGGYRVLVPQVDSDGNELGGIRLPDVSVPVATLMGWAVRAKDAGAAGELCDLDGGYLPFAKLKAERDVNDARPSREERYSSKADYAAKVRDAAAALEREGFLLPEDIARIADKAASVDW